MQNMISNGSTQVRNRERESDTLDISIHATGRDTVSTVRFCPVRDESHEYPNPDPYVTLKLRVRENEHETRDSNAYPRDSAELVVFADMATAREMHKALGEALACSEVK